MKRTFILLVMLSSMVAAALPLIAEGAQEQAETTQPAARPYGWNNTVPPAGQAARQPGQNLPAWQAGQYAQPEQIELSGAVEFTAGHTRLNTADGEVYELMYPMYLADYLEIEAGQSVDVEGFLIPGPRWTAADENADDDQYLRLTKVTIDDEEYELAFGPGSRFAGPDNGRFQGRHPGRMGGKVSGRYDDRSGRAGGFQQGPAYGPDSRGMGSRGPGMMGPRGN